MEKAGFLLHITYLHDAVVLREPTLVESFNQRTTPCTSDVFKLSMMTVETLCF